MSYFQEIIRISRLGQLISDTIFELCLNTSYNEQQACLYRMANYSMLAAMSEFKLSNFAYYLMYFKLLEKSDINVEFIDWINRNPVWIAPDSEALNSMYDKIVQFVDICYAKISDMYLNWNLFTSANIVSEFQDAAIVAKIMVAPVQE